MKAKNNSGSETLSTRGRWDRTLISVQCFLAGNGTRKHGIYKFKAKQMIMTSTDIPIMRQERNYLLCPSEQILKDLFNKHLFYHTSNQHSDVCNYIASI